MEKIFGVPIDQFMLVFLGLFLAAGLVTTVVALRSRVAFRLAVRNIPRRPTQTALIVLGLMLATLLFSAAFSTGDTMTHSLRVQALDDIGEVDVIVRGRDDGSGRRPYFDEALADDLAGRVATLEDVAPSAMPVSLETAPVVAGGSGLNEPAVTVLGVDEARMSGFSPPRTAGGEELPVGSLPGDGVLLSSKAAENLGVALGDGVQVYFGPQPAAMTVAGVYDSGAHPAGEISLVMPLARLQQLTGNEGRVNALLITSTGHLVEGARYTDAVVGALKPALEGTGLEAEPVKQDALDEADQAGASFASIFLLFAQFSVAAGVLLIFLIFVMLAAERKHELGIARAVGAQRGHVVRMFVFEGVVYALMAAAAGSLLGVAVGWGMVRIMAVALGQVDFQLAFSFNWKSVVIAFVMGMVLTFVVVLASSWRVSRLNIVRAIRDIPEPKVSRRSRLRLAAAILLVLGGVLVTAGGYRSLQWGPTALGVSLVIIGLALVARRLGAPDRVAFTAAGVALIVWWLLPASVTERILPEMEAGIEMFFLSGIMLVLGGVWVVIFNADLGLRAIVLVLGRLKGLPPVLKAAVSYPMQNRFRTGMTLSMFSLVIFTLVVMAYIISGLGGLFADPYRLTGGYDLLATASYANPISDFGHELAQLRASSVGTAEEARALAAIETFGGTGAVPVQARPQGSQQEPADITVTAVDDLYAGSVTYDFALRAAGYDSGESVWRALRDEPATAVISAVLVPSRTNFNVGGQQPPFQFEGFYQQDESLPEVMLEVTDPASGYSQELRVVGVLPASAFFGGGVMTSRRTLESLVGRPVPPQTYYLRLHEGADASAVATMLEKRFLANGLQAFDLREELDKAAEANTMINTLLQGFMALGLVVGIAALGVISARSVVERRQQIGVLRAIGFQKGMVQASFLLESSFIALLGIGIGLALGIAVSGQVMDSLAQEIEGLTYDPPWLSILVVTLVAYAASLLTTYIPARQAAAVRPAEALRYE